MVKIETMSSKPHRQVTQVCLIVGGDGAVELFCHYLVPKNTHLMFVETKNKSDSDKESKAKFQFRWLKNIAIDAAFATSKRFF